MNISVSHGIQIELLGLVMCVLLIVCLPCK